MYRYSSVAGFCSAAGLCRRQSVRHTPLGNIGKGSCRFLSFCANLAVAMSTALILLTGRVELESFKRIILTVTLVSVLWGLLPNCGLSLYRGRSRPLAGTGNADTDGFWSGTSHRGQHLGKYMVFPVLLFLPELIKHQRAKHINLIYIFFLIGILMNFTRSSIYGIEIA